MERPGVIFDRVSFAPQFHPVGIACPGENRDRFPAPARPAGHAGRLAHDNAHRHCRICTSVGPGQLAAATGRSSFARNLHARTLAACAGLTKLNRQVCWHKVRKNARICPERPDQDGFQPTVKSDKNDRFFNHGRVRVRSESSSDGPRDRNCRPRAFRHQYLTKSINFRAFRASSRGCVRPFRRKKCSAALRFREIVDTAAIRRAARPVGATERSCAVVQLSCSSMMTCPSA